MTIEVEPQSEAEPVPPLGLVRQTVDLDVPMSVAEFAKFLGVNPRWVRDRLRTMPGVIRENQKHIRIWPRKYLEGSLSTARGRKGAR